MVDNERILTEEGRAQLKRVGEYLRAFDPAVILYSPLKRIQECATIIKKAVANGCRMVEEIRLIEIYDNQHYLALDKDMPTFLDELVEKYAGKQVICVSHQDTIQGTVSSLGVTAAEADFPCRTAHGYRLVFAGQKFVEIQKIRPADAV